MDTYTNSAFAKEAQREWQEPGFIANVNTMVSLKYFNARFCVLHLSAGWHLSV